MSIDQKAKHLLLENSCDNCFWSQNPWKPVAIYCLKHPKQYGDQNGELIEYIVEHQICPSWHTHEINLKTKIVIDHNFRGRIMTQADVDRLTKILEENKDDIV
jgi:hypothetical protein